MFDSIPSLYLSAMRINLNLMDHKSVKESKTKMDQIAIVFSLTSGIRSHIIHRDFLHHFRIWPHRLVDIPLAAPGLDFNTFP